MLSHEAAKYLAEDPIIDWTTGLAINSPLSLQGPPGWMDAQPDVVSRIRMLRAKQGIEVDDFPMMEEASGDA